MIPAVWIVWILHGFSLGSGEREQVASGRARPWFQVYGAVIRSVRRQARSTRLTEDLLEVHVLRRNLLQVQNLLFLRISSWGVSLLETPRRTWGVPPWISCLPQSILGRCLAIHGCPSMTGERGVSMRYKEICSWWLLEIWSLRGIVALVIRPMFSPLRELDTSGLETFTKGTPQRAAVSASRKLSMNPEGRMSSEPLLATPG